MSPIKRHRRIPTVINRGMGLLEVILPGGPSDENEKALPPGQRDASGFWYPAGYQQPSDIFTSAQRRMQVAQRRIQRERFREREPAADPEMPAARVRDVTRGRRSRPPSSDLLLPPPLDDPLPRPTKPRTGSADTARIVDSRKASE